ncbi:MAG: PAS domain S-box protein [Candidatus Hydrogenedentota bacterium]
MEHTNPHTVAPSVLHWHEQTVRFARVGICRCTLKGNIVSIDSKALEILGISPAEHPPGSFHNKPFNSLISDACSPKPVFEVFSQRPEVRDFDVCRTASPEETQWLKFHAYTAEDRSTGQSIVQVLIQDISTQRRAEEALRASERRFRLLAENIPGVIYLCRNDPRYTMLYLNDQVEDLTGYPKESFLSDEVSFAEIYHPDDARSIYREVDRALGKRAPFQLVYRIRHSSGEWRWVEEHGTGVFDEESGDLLFLEGFLHDISERHRVQQALRESEQRYRFLTQNSMDIIARLDSEGRFVYLSPAVETLLNVAPEEMINRSLYEFVHPDEAPAIRSFHEDIRGETGCYHLEHRLRHANGSYPWFETSLHVMINKTTKQREAIAVIRNVTERRRLREKIRSHAENLEAMVAQRTTELEKLQAQSAEMEKLAATGRMAAGVAHEINNPLTGIRNCLTILAKHMPEGHTDRRFLELAQQEIERITRIVHQMYQLYRPEADQPTWIRIEDEMRDVCLMLERTFAKKHLDVHVAVETGIPDARLPEGALRQILYNLLLNAADVSPEQGLVEFRAKAIDNGIEIQVADLGGGIAEDILPRIFEPFFTTKSARGGSAMGLGLSVSRSLATAINAQLEVENKVGTGATFRLLLPLDAGHSPLDGIQ